MKILVPTDFSDTATKALELAIQIAKRSDAQLLIVHIYLLPVLPARNTFYSDQGKGMDNLRKAEDELQRLTEAMTSLKEVKYETKAISMYGPVEIPDILIGLSADLIIMGTHGNEGLKKLILGSNTFSIIDKSPCPVLIVPEMQSLPEIKNIGLSYDGGIIEDLSRLSILVWITKLMAADLQVFRVRNPEENISPEVLENNVQPLLDYLKVSHDSYSEIEGIRVTEGLEQVIAENNIDMLVTIPRQNFLLREFFAGSVTKKLSLRIRIPLLVIP
jgi:nucleotide-binding universal stress UspA family protein